MQVFIHFFTNFYKVGSSLMRVLIILLVKQKNVLDKDEYVQN